MSSNNDILVAIYDENLVPLTGLAPGAAWLFFINLDTGEGATPPTISEILSDGDGTGVYRIGRKSTVGVRYVGKLDFRAGAVPRYYDYDSRYEDGVESDTIQIIAGLVHQNCVIDQTVFNDQGLMTSGQIRVFATAADARAGTNPVATFPFTVVPKAFPHQNQMDSFVMTLQDPDT